MGTSVREQIAVDIVARYQELDRGFAEAEQRVAQGVARINALTTTIATSGAEAARAISTQATQTFAGTEKQIVRTAQVATEASNNIAATAAAAQRASSAQLEQVKRNIAEIRAGIAASNFGQFVNNERTANVRRQWDRDDRVGQGLGSNVGATSTSGLRPRLAPEVSGEDLQKAVQEGQRLARAILTGLELDLQVGMARIAERTAAGLLTKEQAAEKGRLAAKGFNDALRVEIDQASARGAFNGDKGQAMYATLASRFRDVDTESKKAKVSVAGLREPLTALATSALSVPGPVGQLASAVGMMSAGGALTAGVIAGAALIGGAYRLLTKDAAAAKERIEQATDRILAMKREAQSGPVKLAIDISDAQTKLRQLETQIQRLKRAETIDFTPGGVGGLVAGYLGREKEKEAKKLREALTPSAQELYGRSQDELNGRAGTLSALASARQATAADLVEIRRLKAEAERELAALNNSTAPRNSDRFQREAEQRRRLSDRIQTLDAPFQKVEKEAERAERASEKLEASAQAFADRLRDQLESITGVIGGEFRRALRAADAEFTALSKAGALDPAVVRSYEEYRAQLQLAIFAAEQAAKQQQAHANAVSASTKQAQSELQGFESAIQEIAANGLALGGLFAVPEADVARLGQMEQRLAGIAANEKVTAEVRQRASGQLERVRGLVSEIYATGDGKAPPVVESVSALEETLPALAQAGRALLDAASAAGLLDANMVGALNSAINLAAALPKALTGDIGAIAASGAALLNIFAAGRGESEATREGRRVQAENTEALRELAQRIGDIDLGGSGERRALGIEAAQEFARRSQSVGVRTGNGTPGRPTFDGFSTMEALLADVLQRLGLTFEELKAQAAALGIEITETGEGLREYAAATQTAGAKFRDLEERLDVLGVQGAERFRAVLDFMAELPGAAGEAARKVRDGFDLSTQEGRDAAIAYVREQYRLKKISGDAALALIDGIATFGDEVLAAAEAAAAKIDAAFERLAGALRQIDLDRELLGLSPAEVIERTIGAYAKEVPEAFRHLFDDIMEGVDLSTEEGRRLLKSRVQAIYKGFLADGVLDETEAKIAEGLGGIHRLIDDFGEGLLAEAAQLEQRAKDRRVQRASDVSDVRGEDAGARFQRLASVYFDILPDLRSVLQGLDLSTAEGVAEADRRLRAFFETLGEGEAFDPAREAILRLLPILGDAASAFTAAGDAIADAATRASQAQRTAKRLGLSEQDTQQYVFNALANDPVLGPLLAGVNPNDAASRNAGLGTLRDAYTTASGATREQIGQAIDYFLGLDEAAAQAIQAAGGGGDSVSIRASEQKVYADVQTIQERTANRLVEQNAALLIEVSGIRRAVEARAAGSPFDGVVAAYSAAQRQLLEPPNLPAFAAGGASAGGGLRVEIDATHRILGETGPVATLLSSRPDLERALRDVGGDTFKRVVRGVLVELLYEDRAAGGNITSVL